MSFKDKLIIPGLAAIVALILLLLILTVGDTLVTQAAFSGQAASTGNYFSAADSFQVPEQPVISDISPVATCDGATVSWNTNLPADSVVRWSYTSGGPYTTLSDSNPVLTHSILVPGLASGTTVFFLVSSTTADGYSSTSIEDGFMTLEGGKPNLSLSQASSFWSSYDDYIDGLLSVEYRISNHGGADAFPVTIIDAHNTNGVLFLDSSPWEADIPAGGYSPFVFRYLISPMVTGFDSTIYATAQDPCGAVYSYPGPHP